MSTRPPASPLLMWAPIVQGPRSEWIEYGSIRRTRREARDAYRERWTDADEMDQPELVRYAKVVVSLERRTKAP